MKSLGCFIKKNKKHFIWGGISTVVLYATGIVERDQIIPTLIGTTVLSYVGEEYVFNENNKNYDKKEKDKKTESAIDVFTNNVFESCSKR